MGVSVALMIERILSKKTSTIVLSLIGFLVGVILLFMVNFSYSKIYGGIAIVVSLFYLFTENLRSPLLFFLTFFGVSLISVNILNNIGLQESTTLNTILSMVFFVYFAVLGLGYFILKDNIGQFIQSGISSLSFLIIINIVIQKINLNNEKLIIGSIIISVMVLIINTIIFVIRKKGE